MDSAAFTQQLTMHLNGGRHYSRLVYRVVADGRETPITRVRATGGSPRYLITGDAFVCEACRAEFDNLTARGRGLLDWLREHAAPHEARATADEDPAA